MTWLLPSYSWVLLCIHWHQIQGAWFRSRHSSHNLSLLWHSRSSVSSLYCPAQPSPPAFSVWRQKHTASRLCLSGLFRRISRGLSFNSVTGQRRALAQQSSTGQCLCLIWAAGVSPRPCWRFQSEFEVLSLSFHESNQARDMLSAWELQLPHVGLGFNGSNVC